MLHVTITEGSRVLLNEDYEAFIGIGDGNKEIEALGFVRSFHAAKMEAIVENLLKLAEHYAKITVKMKEMEDFINDQN